jgi:hypothetical protein
MISSGIQTDSYTAERSCEVESVEGVDCDFEGEVEVFFDPEVFAQWWACPLCGHERDEEWEDDLE